MMSMILSKMVSSLTSSLRLTQTTGTPHQPTMDSSISPPLNLHQATTTMAVAGNSLSSVLVSCFHGIQLSGSMDAETVHRLDALMSTAGPVCFTDQLVHVCQ